MGVVHVALSVLLRYCETDKGIMSWGSMKRSAGKGEVVFSRKRPLRVLTMNIWTFTEPYAARMRLLRAGIRKLDPDLMTFQEAGLEGKRNQVKEVLSGLGYHVVHQFEVKKHDKRFTNGVCIASRWPVKVAELLSLQVTKHCLHYPYAALAVRVDAPAPVGQMLLVNSKPSWQFSRERERELQAVAVARMTGKHSAKEEFPPVLAGDFDARPDSASIRFLSGKQSLAGMSVHFRDAWAEAGEGSEGLTWTTGSKYVADFVKARLYMQDHARRIDYIFVGSFHDYAKYASIRSCRVVMDKPTSGVWPSDHYAVYAEIDVVR